MSVVMGKKRNDETQSEPIEPRRPNRSGESLHVYIDPAIADALRGYLAATEPEVSKTAAVESALREFLRSKGQWPPKRS